MHQLQQHPSASEIARLSRGAPFFTLLVLGMAALSFFDTPKNRTVSADRLEPADCKAWDQEAVEGITPLLYDDRAVTNLKLDEAMMQLRRARANCKAGSLAVAKKDYASLHRAFPIGIGPIRSVSVPASELSASKKSGSRQNFSTTSRDASE